MSNYNVWFIQTKSSSSQLLHTNILCNQCIPIPSYSNPIPTSCIKPVYSFSKKKAASCRMMAHLLAMQLPQARRKRDGGLLQLRREFHLQLPLFPFSIIANLPYCCQKPRLDFSLPTSNPYSTFRHCLQFFLCLCMPLTSSCTGPTTQDFTKTEDYV